jgi:putative transcription factor
MPCELCGREGRTKPALIDGVKMFVCPDCMKHGTPLSESKPAPIHRAPSQVPSSRKPFAKDIYKGMNEELVDDWSKRIQDGRKKKGLSREELGFRIGERTVIIAKLENGDLRPSDTMIKKLEKELNIKLMEPVQALSTSNIRTSGTALTLGDFIKTEDT